MQKMDEETKSFSESKTFAGEGSKKDTPKKRRKW